jgi:hypothetical protein
MKKILLAGVAAIAIAGSSLAYAQHREWFNHMRMSPEDRAAFADARIAAVKAGLQLTPDQEKLWPPVEAAARDFAKLRIDRANARMNAEKNDANDAQKPEDPVARLHARADKMAATAAALKRIADAADPLYKTLDDGQKRRLKFLAHFGHKEGWRHHEDGDRDRDGDRDHGHDRDHGYDHDSGPDGDHGGRSSDRL